MIVDGIQFYRPIDIDDLLLGMESPYSSVSYCVFIVWSSIYLKRHTIKDLAAGMLVNILAFAVSIIIITVF